MQSVLVRISLVAVHCIVGIERKLLSAIALAEYPWADAIAGMMLLFTFATEYCVATYLRHRFGGSNPIKQVEPFTLPATSRNTHAHGN